MSDVIDFNIPPFVPKCKTYVDEAIDNRKLCGDGPFTKKCHEWIENRTGSKNLLTTSGSTALDMAAILANIQPGDEVIVSSFTFTSSAASFALRGAKLVFVDIRPDTMNIDENLIGEAITEKTKVIVPVHYAGVACEMDKIMEIAKKHNLIVVEDAAQAVMSEYKGRALGTIGDYGCYSFHETKNYSMGEGGAILIKDPALFERAEIIREKGTDRSQFLRGQVDKYTWREPGSSFLPSELNAAYLYAQLEEADKINDHRLKLWDLYYENLSPLAEAGKIELPVIPEGCKQNGHMFYLKVKDIKVRTELIAFLKENNIQAVFHYIPLHSAPAGKIWGRFSGEDKYTTKESERLLRLPMHYDLTEEDVSRVSEKVKEFFCERGLNL